MNDFQPCLLADGVIEQESHLQTYNLPRLKHLPVREQPAFRVAKDSDACSLAELLAVIIVKSKHHSLDHNLLRWNHPDAFPSRYQRV
jgi:hypothetical protein